MARSSSINPTTHLQSASAPLLPLNHTSQRAPTMDSVDADWLTVEFHNNLKAEFSDPVQRLSRAQLSNDRSPHRLVPGTTITISNTVQPQPYVYHGETSSDKEVVLKFTLKPKRLMEGARFYATSLSGAQGKLVPYCYGLYNGKMQNGKQVSCLVIEKFGRTVSEDCMESASVDSKMRVMDSLSELHAQYGTRHEISNFNWSNVIFSNDLKDFRFVGFGGGKGNHECRLDKPLREYKGFQVVPCKALASAMEACVVSVRRVNFEACALHGDIPDKDDCIALLTQWGLLEFTSMQGVPVTQLVPFLERAMVARRNCIGYSEMIPKSKHIEGLQDFIDYFKNKEWTKPSDDEGSVLDFPLKLEDDVDEADSGADSGADSEGAGSGASSGAGPETDSGAD